MHHFYHPRLWETFFEALGAEVVLSPPTHRHIVEQAGRISEAEHCLPAKLLDGHVDALADQVDAVFIPRYLSILPKHVTCAKFGAMPDFARIHLQGRARVLTVEVDMNREPMDATLLRFGRELGCQPDLAKAAAAKALDAWKHAEDAPAGLEKNIGQPCILLVAHPYLLHDDFFMGPIISKLEDMAVQPRRLRCSDRDVRPGFIRWDSCNKMFHAVCALRRGEVAGVIQVSSFQCGCDSMTMEFFRAAVREKGIPYMALMMDEHTAQGGVETRLEAFVDSMRF
jgi:predicted nucleotide-binding protein (sugar kinase/HSP70/actin superfamily)